ncbi:MAG: hypothetical protein ACFB6R_06070, partial [Alphaproteobacteria bacterium]
VGQNGFLEAIFGATIPSRLRIEVQNRSVGVQMAPRNAILDFIWGMSDYGPEHMQIAALMVEGATGQKFKELQQDRLFDPLGLSTATRYLPSTGDNPRYAGSLQSSVNDYAIILQALLAGDLVTDFEGYLEDRTAGVIFGFRPEAVSTGMRDWHYAFGFWKECDASVYTIECDENPVISSPGAFGWTPWVDFENGYWGLVAFEETGTRDFSPSAASVDLQQEIQSIVEAQLNR